MTQLNKEIIAAIRLVMECESSRGKIRFPRSGTLQALNQRINSLHAYPLHSFLCPLSLTPSIVFSIPNEPGCTDENVLGLRGKKTNPQQLLSLLLLLLMLCFSLCYVKRGVTAYKVRLQEETEGGIGVM